MPKPENITQEQFDETLMDILSEMKGSSLLDIPGVYEVVSEHFNNEVIRRIYEARYEEQELAADGA
jgi:hypothetical protein